MLEVLKDRGSQSMSVAGNPMLTIPNPDKLGDHVDNTNLEFQQKRQKIGINLSMGWKLISMIYLMMLRSRCPFKVLTEKSEISHTNVGAKAKE